MPHTIALIHTSPAMIPIFKHLRDELLPKDANVFNMVDESLLCDIIRDWLVTSFPPTRRARNSSW
jgi:hypothetical protein